MGASKTRAGLSARLEGIRQRFERWRRTRNAGARIPDVLWAAAVRAAGRHGIHRTARALRLDYYSLKERVEQQSAVAPEAAERAAADQHRPHEPTTASRKRVPRRRPARSVPTFLELAAPAGHGFAAAGTVATPWSVGPCECTLEWEDAGGAKMRVHLKGAATPDLAALSRSFWNHQP